MSGRLIIVVAVLLGMVLAVGAPRRASAEAGEEFANSAEGKVLARYVGKWVSEVEYIGGEETKKGTDAGEARWALKGRYLQYKVKSTMDDSESLHLLTYDAEQKVYRSWWFNSTGRNSSASGTWDEATKKFSWTGTPTPGTTMTWVEQFTDDDTRVGEVSIKDGDGKVVFGIKWKAVRKK